VATLRQLLNAPTGADPGDVLDTLALSWLRDGRVRQLVGHHRSLRRLQLDDRPRAELIRSWVLDATGAGAGDIALRAVAAYDHLDASSDVTGAGAAAWVLGRHHLTHGNPDEAARWLGAGAERLPSGICLDHDTLVFLATHQFWRDGDVTASLRSSRLALAIALAHDERLAAADVLVHLGFLRYLAADDRAAELALDRADDLYAELDPAPGSTLRPLLDTYHATIAVSEGRRDEAVERFRAGAASAIELDTPWLAAINDARFAMALPDHPDAAAAARRTITVPPCVERGWTPSMGWRALAMVEQANGQPDLAHQHYRRALTEPSNELETTYIEASCILADLEAYPVEQVLLELSAIVDTYERLGAVYPLVATLLTFSFRLPDHAGELLAQAHRRSGSSTICDHIWRYRPELTIDLDQGVLALGGQRLRLSGKPLELVLTLVDDDARTMHWEVVASQLWPDEDEPAKLRSRMTTATSTARRQLGSEAWRLERDGQFLQFVMRRATVVHDDTIAQVNPAGDPPAHQGRRR
jgi:tetratricopeptide (TPR) repeat protein